MKEALFYEKLKNKEVKCVLCPRNCVIKENSSGFCRARKNIKGKLYSLVFGKPAAQNMDPIEKKPLYHFRPGSFVFSIGTVSCNFRCPFCCNWDITTESPGSAFETDLSPEQAVKKALSYGASGIAYTYNEPTIFFEYAYETAKLAKKNGLFNVFVTNGYTEIKPVKKISKYLDAVVIDLKGFNSGYYEKVIKGNLEKIKSAVLEYKKNNVWVEISNLVIEGINDSNEDMKEMCRWISSELGKNIPLHIIGFYPSYLMKKTKPAGIGRIKEIYSIAKSYGLKYVYARFEDKFDTKCTKCGRTAVARSLYDFSVMENNTDNGRCVFCGAQADIKV